MLFRDPLGTYGAVKAPTQPVSSFARFILAAALVTFMTTGYALYTYPQTENLKKITENLPAIPKLPNLPSFPSFKPTSESSQAAAAYDLLLQDHDSKDLHAIDELISRARKLQDAQLTEQSHDVATAAARYRTRRGRHPPPGFDKWMAYALDHNAIVVEKFFDRIYHDLTPFWALDPNTTASRAESWHHVVRVRDGVASGVGNTEGLVAWLELWTSLVAEAAPFLPDVDMPINYMDESRLLVKWEDIAAYVDTERRGRKMPSADDVFQNYTGLAHVDARGHGNGTKAYDPAWITKDSPRYWDLARKTCPPGSPSRNVQALSDFSNPPSFPPKWKPAFSYHGYVQNFSAAADPCTQPHLRSLHGTFVEPLSTSTSTELIPLFGGSKLTMNNEILIPGAMYLTGDPFYSGGEDHGPPWDTKNTTIVWRGAASGGRNKKDNWMHFQRHRLLEMLNATTVSRIEKSGGRAKTFEIPGVRAYDFERRRDRTIGELLDVISDTGFNDLLCFPRDECDYVTPYFHEVPSLPMRAQYGDKFIPDADGNSFSARFRGLLMSTSLPLKATIYAEWHDDRLLPWLHFVPLDNTFQDLYAVLAYLVDTDQGDAAAHMIASAGKLWAEKVLRRDDMLLYVWRLLLEFARVCDENRDNMGYVEDLL